MKKILFILVAGFLLISCKPKPGNSKVSSDSSINPSDPRVTIATDLEDITMVNSSNFSVSGTCSEEGQAVTVSVGDVNATATCTSGAWSAEIDLSSLSGASRVIAITADHASSGGQNATQATANVTLNLNPIVSINSQLLEDITMANSSSFSVSGTCSEEDQAVTVSVGDVNATATCTSGAWSAEIDLSSLSGASRVIAITADHASSGGQNATQATASVTLNLNPIVSINSQLLEDITVANSSSFSVSGTCSEEGQAVTVSVGGVNATATCTSGAWSAEIDLSSLSGASRVIAITADHASSGGQNATQATASVTLNLNPIVSINSQLLEDITVANSSSFSVSGTCSEEGQAVTVSVGGLNPETAPLCTSGAWSAEVDLSSLSGTSRNIAITADHASSGGQNATQATASVIFNPMISINTRVLEDITADNAARFSVSGSCAEEGQPVDVSVGAISPETNPNCTSGVWSITVDVTGLNKITEVSITADHSPAGGSAYPQATASVTNNFTCPENYVGVPELSDYTTNSFCVMKYEAKNNGSDGATSQASGAPYVELNRNASIGKCEALGEDHDLITNDEWQSLARNIELVRDNWAAGAIGNAGGLSRGHSDNSPSRALAASGNDTEGCSETGQTCNGNTWDSQRRTHTLSNGEVIWDVAGNVWEWVKDENASKYGSNTYFSQVTADSHSISNSLSNGTTTISRAAKAQFGPSGNYTNLNMSPYGGLGFASINYKAGGTLRGGVWEDGVGAGAFATALGGPAGDAYSTIGFRCVYHP